MEVSFQHHIPADLHLVKVPLFNCWQKTWRISDQYGLSSKGKILYPSREYKFDFPAIQPVVSIMNGPSLFSVTGLYVFFILYFRFIRLLAWLFLICLKTLSVAHVVPSDWNIKHPIYEREFGLSVKIIKIRYQTQY